MLAPLAARGMSVHMRASMKLRHIPGRLVTGAFILNSGLGKRGADDETAKRLQGMAVQAFPWLGSVQPARFAQVLSAGEIALGAALLNPLVPSALAGAGLSGFAAGLLRMYMKIPGMRREGSVRPTQQGTVLAKDVWMLGIGAGLVLDGLGASRRERRKR